MKTRDCNLWGVILSGGEGTRLQNFIKRLYGIVRPKQYCSIVGRRSMLQHTHDRVQILIPCEKILTVINRSHLSYLGTQFDHQTDPNVLVQPCGRETANGILFALLNIYDRSPEAVAGVFPSDHFIQEEAKFMQYVDIAYQLVRENRGGIAMLGVRPVEIEQGYGWIEKAVPVRNPWNINVNRIMKFWEKPDRQAAEILYRRNCLWNTFVMVGRVKYFLRLFTKMVPDIFNKLSQLVKFKNKNERENFLNLVYPALPSVNFSKAILEQSANRFCVVQADDVYWSDWGDERRVLRDVERFHLRLNSVFDDSRRLRSKQ